MRRRWLCAAVVLALCACMGAAEAELVGYWPFDATVADASGNGRDGTNLLNVSYAPATPFLYGSGQSLALGGSTRVDIPASPALNSQAFTLAYWFNQAGAVQNGPYERVTSRGSDTFETALSPDGDLRYYSRGGPGWQDSGHDLPRAGWQHVAFVSNGANVGVFVDGQHVHTGALGQDPSGILRIGARANIWTEGSEGKIDDVALWDTPLAPSSIAALAGQSHRPTDLTTTTVISDPASWNLSTARTTGGPMGTWTPSGAPLPGAATYTLPASPTPMGHILGAAADLGLGTFVGDGGGSAPTGVQYYRTTFDLPDFEQVAANLVLAVDNGAQVFINGAEIARETSFAVENWARPYSTLSINADGSIGSVTLFDQVATNFSDWRVGQNELVIAIRNPDPEGIPGGGLTFRLDVDTSLRPPDDLTTLTRVTSDPSHWMLSTVRTTGGPMGTWTPSGAPPPAAPTFILTPSPSTAAGIVAAGSDLGVATLLGDGGAGLPEGVLYYRTTFDLDHFTGIRAELVLAVDNGAQVYINGVEIARETSFLVENWQRPYSSLTIDPDGSISDVTLFDWAASSFTGFRDGENEIIIALRNPDAEGLNGGGIAFRMDIQTSIPEPATLALLAVGGVGALIRRRRRRR